MPARLVLLLLLPLAAGALLLASRWDPPPAGAGEVARDRPEAGSQELLLSVPDALGASEPEAASLLGRAARASEGDAPTGVQAGVEEPAACMPLDVRFVDAESGLAVDAVLTEKQAVTRTRAVLTAEPGLRHTVGVAAVPPDVYVAWDRDSWHVPVGRWTTALEAVYPLRREVDVRVSVLDHRGRPEPEAEIRGFSVAGRSASVVKADALGLGAFRLRGVPHLRGETLAVCAATPDMRLPEWREVALPEHPADRTEITIQLPPPDTENPQPESTIGIGGGCGSSRFCGRSRGPHGTLVVTGLRHDGSPASGALVFVDRRRYQLDEHGVLRQESCSVGEHAVSLEAIGLLPVRGKVTVEEGQVAHLELREPKGGILELLVTDADGAPLPFAELVVRTSSKQPWIDETGGVQRVDPFVDHAGRRRLGRVETGTVKVEVTWASRKGTAEIQIREGRVAYATIVLTTAP